MEQNFLSWSQIGYEYPSDLTFRPYRTPHNEKFDFMKHGGCGFDEMEV
jgi:hypothetical protein